MQAKGHAPVPSPMMKPPRFSPNKMEWSKGVNLLPTLPGPQMMNLIQARPASSEELVKGLHPSQERLLILSQRRKARLILRQKRSAKLTASPSTAWSTRLYCQFMSLQTRETASLTLSPPAWSICWFIILAPTISADFHSRSRLFERIATTKLSATFWSINC